MSRFPQGVLIVDLETTGFAPSRAQIIEIGITYVTAQGVIGAPVAQVACPPQPIPDDPGTLRALEINQITRTEIAAAKPLGQVLEELRAHWHALGEPPLLAYPNRFEAGFLSAAGLTFPRWEFCLMQVGGKFVGRQPKLVEVADALLLDYDASTLHRAGPDAHLEARVFVGLVNQGRWPSPQ